MLKHILIVTVTVLSVSTLAFAGEGNGDPFPGPDAGVLKQIQAPKYTMGADAPFNYFGTDTPTPLTNYTQSQAGADDPYPFQMNGQVIQTQPMPRTSVATSPAASNGTHG